MACAVQSMAPQPVHDRPYSAGENCGAAGLPAVKEPDKPAEQVRTVRGPRRLSMACVMWLHSFGDWL